MEAKKKISILGATGTIGLNASDIISKNPDNFEVESLIAGSNYKALIEQGIKLKAKTLVLQDEELYLDFKEESKDFGFEILCGEDAIEEVSARKVDLFLSGAVGFCALKPTISAIKSGNKIGLANKECLVCAGELMMGEVEKNNTQLIPIDSEHNSLYQVFDFDKKESISKIILTASGGPFRKSSFEHLKAVTPQMAVNHPNWSMGAKISVDSATMMNKGLEVIEAFYLFGVERSQIEVVVHPESIIHGLVYYEDGSVLAGMSNPDMRAPIAYALAHPERINSQVEVLDLVKTGKFSFESPDLEKFKCLRLAKEALNLGGVFMTALNASNEVAVERFLNNEISFLQIADINEKTLEKINSFGKTGFDNLEEVFEVDNSARAYADEIINKKAA